MQTQTLLDRSGDVQSMDVLVIDVGGSHVKMMASGASSPRRFDSGDDLTPAQLVDIVSRHTADWRYSVVSLGFPGAVDANGPKGEPGKTSAPDG